MSKFGVETCPIKFAVETRPDKLSTFREVALSTPVFTWIVLRDVAMISPVTRYPALDPIFSESTVRVDT